MPALFCRSHALAFPPSAVGSMSEGGVLIRPRFICRGEEERRQGEEERREREREKGGGGEMKEERGEERHRAQGKVSTHCKDTINN